MAKSEESRPHLKWPIYFLLFSQKCLFTELEPSQVKNFDAILLLLRQFSEKIHFLTFSQDIFSDPKMPEDIKIWKFFDIHYTLFSSYWLHELSCFCLIQQDANIQE